MDFDTRLATYAVIVDTQDRVLLALWNEVDPPQWTLPGGGVEFDETLSEALVRELSEETGYDVEPGVLLGVDTLTVAGDERIPDPGRALRNVRVIYEAAIVGGALGREVDGTTDEARWIPLADVEALRRGALVDAGIALWHEYWGT